MATYKEITCVSACNKIKSARLPYSWDMNIYRGCEHGCKYCFAMYSHQYLDDEAYFDSIYVKTNIAEQLERQFSRPSWKREVVSIGGVTDSYQPAEKNYKMMPDILRLFIKYKTPAIISTKSELILRDYDLIAELARLTYVNIAETITCMDEEVRRRLEPNGAPSLRRVRVLKEFSKTEASTGLHVMPIVPYMTDSRENLSALLENARECGVSYLLPGVMYLRGKTRRTFFDFVKRDFPALYLPLMELYKSGGADNEYKRALYETVNGLMTKYGVSSSFREPMKQRLRQFEPEQLSLFKEK